MGTREWLLTAAVIVVPLVIAIVVTGWSLEQARYRPRRKRQSSLARDKALSAEESVEERHE
ncbi:MAG: hypothetical protein U0031_07190 [Thermomicrobiales bacterium]